MFSQVYSVYYTVSCYIDTNNAITLNAALSQILPRPQRFCVVKTVPYQKYYPVRALIMARPFS